MLQVQNSNLISKGNLLFLLLLLLWLATQSVSVKINTTAIAETPPKTTTTTQSGNLTPHHFTSNNNITILHEIHEASNDEKPLELNIHEVLPSKPTKKKPLTHLDKALEIHYEKPSQPVKDYDLNPVAFDFNLGDLEDIATSEASGKSPLELTSSEAKHLLSDIGGGGEIKGDIGMAYSEIAHEENVSDGLDIEVALDEASTTTNSTTVKQLSTTTLSTSLTGLPTDLPTVVTVSPHIFKILKNKSIKKERELLKNGDDAPKRFGTNFNSIDEFGSQGDGTDDAANVNGSSASSAAAVAAANGALQHSANLFQIVTNLYDHFYWQSSDIRAKVTTGCGLEMQAYLTALHENFDWAQKAYDSSGRYRGQIFYGNDKWLGERTFCYELNRQLRPEERKHFEFEFFVAVIGIRIWIPQKMELQLQIGECLPKSCTSQDVHAILVLDPHAQGLIHLGYQGTASQANSTNSTQILIKRVRTVPGIFSFWRELRFQIFVSFIFTLVLLVVVATFYQAKLNENHFTAQIPAISTKVDATLRSCGNSNGNAEFPNMGKGLELYQMRTLGDNNNVVVVDNEVETNGKGDHNNGMGREMGDKTISADVEKAAQMADYRMETGSSIGAGGTYEAKKPLGLHEQALLCFAFQTNSGVIFDIDASKENQTACVHGLRVFSILWTIMVHTYLQMFNIGENRYRRIIGERSVWYQVVGNATFSVDTFFFISGFLVTLLFLRQTKNYPEDTRQFVKRSCKDTIVLLIYRYIRLTPAYLFVIFFNDFALRQAADTSVFQPTVAITTCSQYWWRNILYINNFYPLSEICMIWSWYMANDMQFYIMASLLLVLSTRYLKTAALVVGTFLLSSWGITGVISLHYHYTHKVANPFESFDFLYDKPWQRVGTYLVGMLTGYVIFKVKTPPRIPQRVNFLLWLGSFGLLALIIFGVWQGQLSELSTAFYVSVGHTAFGLGLVWIVLSCCWGMAPTWNRILSYRGLWPLSRLTYCTYLIHPIIMLLTSFIMDGTSHLNHVFIFTIFLGNVLLSFSVAFFISVIFEAPMIRLLKLSLKKK